MIKILCIIISLSFAFNSSISDENQQMVQQILGIDSFRGAVNWLHHHFPELKVNERIKKLHNSAKKH